MHDKIVKKRFGWWVQDRREALGLTKSDIVERTGLTYEQVGKIERGVHIPYGERMLKLLIALDVDEQPGLLREIVERMGEK